MDEKEAQKYIPVKFVEIARNIWGDAIVDQMDIRYEIAPKKVKIAGLATTRSKLAARRCHGFYKINVLLANPIFFTYNKEDIDRILIHEAVHLGIHRHDARFREMCLEHGGSLTHNHLIEKKVKLQIKKGNRFVDFEYNGKIPTFNTIKEAKDYGMTYLCMYPKERLRAFY